MEFVLVKVFSLTFLTLERFLFLEGGSSPIFIIWLLSKEAYGFSISARSMSLPESFKLWSIVSSLIGAGGSCEPISMVEGRLFCRGQSDLVFPCPIFG